LFSLFSTGRPKYTSFLEALHSFLGDGQSLEFLCCVWRVAATSTAFLAATWWVGKVCWVLLVGGCQSFAELQEAGFFLRWGSGCEHEVVGVVLAMSGCSPWSSVQAAA
jgi:hypothetical protein